MKKMLLVLSISAATCGTLLTIEGPRGPIFAIMTADTGANGPGGDFCDSQTDDHGSFPSDMPDQGSSI